MSGRACEHAAPPPPPKACGSESATSSVRRWWSLWARKSPGTCVACARREHGPATAPPAPARPYPSRADGPRTALSIDVDGGLARGEVKEVRFKQLAQRRAAEELRAQRGQLCVDPPQHAPQHAAADGVRLGGERRGARRPGRGGARGGGERWEARAALGVEPGLKARLPERLRSRRRLGRQLHALGWSGGLGQAQHDVSTLELLA